MGAELGHKMHILDVGGSFPGVEGAKVRFEEVTLGPAMSHWALWGRAGRVIMTVGGEPTVSGSHVPCAVLWFAWILLLTYVTLEHMRHIEVMSLPESTAQLAAHLALPDSSPHTNLRLNQAIFA